MRSEAVGCAECHPASLQDCGRLSCSSGQLAVAGQPAARRRADVWRRPGGQLLGGYSCSLFCWVSAASLSLRLISTVLGLFSSFGNLFFYICSSRSESYWTAVVGEFDITKTDPDEQLLKVNRIIPHPKVTIEEFGYKLYFASNQASFL